MAAPQGPQSGKPRNSTQSPITTKSLATWAKTGRPHRYPCGRGLYFQTRRTSVSWVFRFRFGGARRAMGLGAFPEVSLAAAREKAERARLALREGRDPIAERDAAATQAQAQDSTSRQENAALRQKVAVLEQELAQQRAMVKAARQEGLAVRALKAAMTKPNDGVVGYHDANLEFHEAECPPPHPLLIPSCVPEEARPAIAEMWESNLPDKEVRMALKRLATDRDLWGKLRNVKGVAEIIPSAIEALVMFGPRRLPPQSKQREAWQRYQKHLDKLRINHPHPTGGLRTLATSAIDLRYALDSLREVLAPTGDEEWSRYWRGNPAMNSMGAAISFLAALQDCLIAIDDDQRSDVKGCLPTNRWDLRAPQRFFAQIMADKMQELCGRPRRDVAAELVRVAFNLKVKDVTTDIVREWCRKTGK